MLVVIAIIAILIGLLLPAVQKVREATARRHHHNTKQTAPSKALFHELRSKFALKSNNSPRRDVTAG